MVLRVELVFGTGRVVVTNNVLVLLLLGLNVGNGTGTSVLDAVVEDVGDLFQRESFSLYRRVSCCFGDTEKVCTYPGRRSTR